METLLSLIITAIVCLWSHLYIENKKQAERDSRARIAAIINAERAAAVAHYNASYQRLSGDFYGSY